jgi:hypothetical protein
LLAGGWRLVQSKAILVPRKGVIGSKRDWMFGAAARRSWL